MAESRQCLRPAIKVQILTVLKWGEKSLENEVEAFPEAEPRRPYPALRNLRDRLAQTSRLIGDVERIPECE